MIAGRKVVTLLQRLLAVGGFIGHEAPGLDELGETGTGGRIVFDDQDPFGGRNLRFCSV